MLFFVICALLVIVQRLNAENKNFVPIIILFIIDNRMLFDLCIGLSSEGYGE